MGVETVPTEVLSILRANAAREERLAILAGAGISRRAPSNLPTAGEMMISILRRLLSPEVFLRSADLLNAERPGRHSPKDFIRFESLVRTLAQYSRDANLTFLNYLAESRSPNRNHYLLAGLIENGHPVLTTNFDGLIETACVRRGFYPIVLAEEATFRKWSPGSDRPSLFKLHGSFEVEGRDSRGSLRASLDSIVRAGDTDVMLEESKLAVLSRIVASHDLLVMGYSGADDFDILPALQRIHAPGRKIIWINHAPGLANCRLFRFNDLLACPRDVHGFFLAERVTLLDALVREGARDTNDVFLVDCDTDEVVRFLEGIYGVMMVPDDAPSYDINLEQFITRWFERNLPLVSDRWYIGSIILFERERYEDSLQLLDQVIADSAGNADRLVKATQAKVNYFLRNSDFAAAAASLAGIVDAVNSHGERGVKGMYWHQVGYVDFNLGDQALFKYQWQDALSHFRKALDAYQNALRAWKATRDAEGMSATLHQLGLLFARLSEPERLQAIFEAETEKISFIRIVVVSRRTLIDRIRAPFKKLASLLQPWMRPVQRWWNLRKALQCFTKAMDIAKTAGLWERYCESASQMASILHLKQEYKREIKVLADALRRGSLLGKTYITGGIFGQLGYALLFCGEYRRAHASLVLAERLTRESGGVHGNELQSAFKMLKERVGNSTLSEERIKLELLGNRELAEAVLGGR